ncbi:MAG: Putative amidophosphoribosyltransferase [uncultured Sulfurovum sp.]|uniref:Amidophosphoribosyltransferase n=1 Tax=uncultured Sulfurovum sp. TaxID=269237 RepID=A0A6S6T187_9BACT|nr:MAG: Putative amidophosphoribosyltransferase [uncultured Sulfurovum sp.]
MIKIDGNWKAGYAIDLHTISSVYLGENLDGQPEFDNDRSEMGELINRLKYHSDETAIPKIIELINKNLKNITAVDFIIPVPPSNLKRVFQPVYKIVEELSKSSRVPLLKNVLSKNNVEELKSIINPAQREALLRDSLKLNPQIDIENKVILLIDDVYRSGATVRAVTDLLYNQAKVKSVYVLTMTKTRSKR